MDSSFDGPSEDVLAFKSFNVIRPPGGYFKNFDIGVSDDDSSASFDCTRFNVGSIPIETNFPSSSSLFDITWEQKSGPNFTESCLSSWTVSPIETVKTLHRNTSHNSDGTSVWSSTLSSSTISLNSSKECETFRNDSNTGVAGCDFLMENSTSELQLFADSSSTSRSAGKTSDLHLPESNSIQDFGHEICDDNKVIFDLNKRYDIDNCVITGNAQKDVNRVRNFLTGKKRFHCRRQDRKQLMNEDLLTVISKQRKSSDSAFKKCFNKAKNNIRKFFQKIKRGKSQDN